MQRVDRSVLAALVTGLALGCARKPTGESALPPTKDSDVTLPSLDGLGLAKVGPLDEDAEGPAGAAKWLRKITVDVPAEGAPVIVDVRDASRWRGVTLPRDEGSSIMLPRKDPRGIRVAVDERGALTINRMGCEDLPHFRRSLGELVKRAPGLDVVLDARGTAPYGKILRVMAAMAEDGVRFKFQAPAVNADLPDAPTVVARLKAEAGRALKDAGGMPNVCVRIRADARAQYRAVQCVMVAAMRAYIWRLSFVGLLDGREVEIGEAYVAPGEPVQARDVPVVVVVQEAEISRAPFEERDKDILEEAEIEHPVFIIHEEIERPDFMHEEAPARLTEDAISDIPLGGRGVVHGMGVGGGNVGSFGFRTGGNRRRAALRGGGSRASEQAVDAALAWLARNQEPDGHWDAAKHGGDADVDAAVTGLAALAFLGAGHTEKTGKHKPVVRKAVRWIVGRQEADGRIGGDSERLGLVHAVCGLALAEAYGMARVGATGEAARKAVAYSVHLHRAEGSGWGLDRKGPPDALVTGWFVAQLKSARMAGLLVEAEAFRDAAAFLGPKLEPAPPTPPHAAAAVYGLRLMGGRRDDPRILGGAAYLAENLPRWEPGEASFDFRYWHFATLAMFHMGGDWWKQWNAAMRDMLIKHQRQGDPDAGGDLAGSWDPVDKWGKVGGRVYSTAVCAMCLETYYRYLPLYED